jgi:SAM-dependent methyltransferase
MTSLVRHARRALGFRRRRPWVSRFEVGGRAYGGSWDAAQDVRLSRFAQTFRDARTILELGCIDGGATFVLAARPGAQVTAIDPRAANIERARFVQRELGVGNVQFRVHDVEVDAIKSLGRFDTVVSLGLLSHLPNPADAIDDLATAADGVFLWCHVCRDDEVEGRVGDLPGRWVREPRAPDPFAGLSPLSFWPTRDALLERLKMNGFELVLDDDEPEHPHGPALTVAARLTR